MAFKTLPLATGASSPAAPTVKPWVPNVTENAGAYIRYAGRIYERRATGPSGTAFTFANYKPVNLSTLRTVAALDREVPFVCLHGDDPTTAVKATVRRGFTPVWVSEIIAAMRGQLALPPNPICFTHDDCRQPNYGLAHPVYQAYAFKVTHNVISGYVDGETDIDPNLPQSDPPGTLNGAAAMSWDQMREMHATGLYEWQNHTRKHYDIDTQTKAQLAADLAWCSDRVVAELGVPRPEAFAFPRGSTSMAATQTVAEAGMVLAYDINGNIMQTDQAGRLPASPLTLPRAPNTQLLDRAYQSVFYDWTTEIAGQPNAANALGLWVPTTGSLLTVAGSGIEWRVTRANATTAGSLELADFYKVVPGDRVRFMGSLLTVSQTAGTGSLKIKQYDINKAPLADIDLATYTTTTAAARLDVTKTLDPACEFVKLRIDVSADNPGDFRMRDGTFRVARPGVV